MLYRHRRGTPVHGVKFNATFDAPPEALLALAHEFDLTSSWNKFVMVSLILAQPSLLRGLIYVNSWLPWPIKNRSLAMDAVGWDLLSEMGCCLIVMRHLAGEKKYGAQDDAQEKLVGAAEARYKSVRCVLQGPSGIRLTPLPPAAPTAQPVSDNEDKGAHNGVGADGGAYGGADGEARVAASMMVQVDPGFGKLSVPVWLINFVLKVMAPYIYRMLQKLLTSAKHFGRDGVYTSRMDGNRALYAFVRRRSRAAVGLRAEPADGSAFPHVYEGPPQPGPTDGRQY